MVGFMSVPFIKLSPTKGPIVFAAAIANHGHVDIDQSPEVEHLTLD